MRVPKAREARAGLVVRLMRVVWVVSLTGTALVGGVYWLGRSHCPEPCRIDGQHVNASARSQPTPQAAIGVRPKTVR